MESPTHVYRSKITFADTDASGIMHFASIFHHVEAAEHDYFLKNGLIIHDPAEGGWPRVHLVCDYERPLKAHDEIDVQIKLTKVGKASVVWDFVVCKTNGELAITGSMANVRIGVNGRPKEISEQERKVLH